MKTSTIFILFVLCSCGATYHLQQSERHKLIAIAKGAKVSADTVYKEVIRYKEIPADSAKKEVKPVIDIEAFDNTMFGNDSLVLLIDSLHDELKNPNTTIDKEKTMYALKQANRRINELKRRISQGFSKDSTYTFHTDSITDVFVTLKNGLVSAVGYNRKRTEITWQERIPIWIDTKVKAGFTVVEYIGGIVGGAFLMFLILVLIRVFKEKAG